MSHRMCLSWLRIASIVLIVLGIALAWATAAPLSPVNVLFMDVALWPVDGAQSYAAPETRLFSAIAGGLTAGLGAAILVVTREVLAHDPARGRRMILTFMLVWFVVDSIGSLIAGAWMNAILNTIVLAAVVWPLIAVRTAQPAT